MARPTGAGAGAVIAVAPPSAAANMSRLLTRPPAPVPDTWARSIWFSRAIRRTRGELRILSPPLCREGCAGLGTAAGADAFAGIGAAGGAGAGFEAPGFSAAAGPALAEALAVEVGLAGGGAAAAGWLGAPAGSIKATTVCIGTVWPSLTLISFSTPADGDGISASTLSVEISKSGSSRSILSPGFFSHLVMVPSKMLSPI